jgi:hypothetical protein
MKQATIHSVCECESQLEAVIDEQCHVLAGFVTGATDGIRERSPAHSIEVTKTRFDVAWLCPVCGRNTLRSFDAARLSFRDGELPAPAAVPLPQLAGVPGPGPSTPGLRWVAARGPSSSRVGAATPPASTNAGPAVPGARPSSAPSAAGGALAGSPVATAVALKSMSTHKTSVPPPKPASVAPSPAVPPSRPSAAPGVPPSRPSAAPGVPPSRPSAAPGVPSAPAASPAAPQAPASAPAPAPSPTTPPDREKP